jgi:plasmid stabilization system protein ParE
VNVLTTPRAEQRAAKIARWWRKERPDAPSLFEEELLRAFKKLADGPTFGLVCGVHRGFAVRRILLPASEQYVYFSVNRDADSVMVLTIWGARRGHQPQW